MYESAKTTDFVTRFRLLNENNQKYILAIQQALMYAQETEKAPSHSRKITNTAGQSNNQCSLYTDN